jgi:glycerate-2-kinase
MFPLRDPQAGLPLTQKLVQNRRQAKTVSDALRLGVDIPLALKRHDTLASLKTLNSLVLTGHTGTNLQNLRVLLMG